MMTLDEIATVCERAEALALSSARIEQSSRDRIMRTAPMTVCCDRTEDLQRAQAHLAQSAAIVQAYRP